MRSVIVRGPLGVGKTTVARKLAERLQGPYVSIDQVLDDHGLDQTDEPCIPLRNFLEGNAIALAQARAALDAGGAAVFDGNFYHLGQLEDLVSRLPEGAAVFTLTASLDTCVARDRGRELSYGPDAAAAVHFLVSQVEYGTYVDTEGKTADQVVAELCLRLEPADRAE